MILDSVIISESASLREALECIENNHQGMVFVRDASGAIVAMATDGDLRRYLLEGGTLEDSIARCANADFVWEYPDAPKETLLKKLDDRVRVIPLLDHAKKLVRVVRRDDLPARAEGGLYARARAPVRVSFGGGGSDLTHYFANSGEGAVINSAISLYTHATLRLREDKRVVVRSLDLGETLDTVDLAAGMSAEGRFGLIQALLKSVKPDFGFELYIHSDFPMSSGLGGSACVSAAILGCFNALRRDQWSLHELAEMAYQSERHYMRVAGGWQDQYATVFGGFNFMEFRMEQNIVHPLRIQSDTLSELEESLVLCDTGIAHDSGDIHDSQRDKMAASDVRSLVEKNVRLCYSMRNDLLRGRLDDFGRALDSAWQLKRLLSDKITSFQLDKIYSEALEHGALGGKLLGAGGGGFFLFYVPAYEKHKLITHLEETGLRVRPFRFEPNGLETWTVREQSTPR